MRTLLIICISLFCVTYLKAQSELHIICSQSGITERIFHLNPTIIEPGYLPGNGAGTLTLPSGYFKPDSKAGRHLVSTIDSLHSLGYLAASADTIHYTNNVITIKLYKGARYNNIKLTFDKNIIEILQDKRLETTDNQAVSREEYRYIQNVILDYYENNGYPFAAVYLDNIRILGDTIKGVMVTEKNRFYTIDSIHIYGSSSVNRKHLYRHIGIKPGDKYSENSLLRATARIDRTPFLSAPREAEVEFISNSADLYLYLDRQNASSFSGIAGLIPGESSNRPKLAGELRLSLMNVFNRMEHIDLYWQSPDTRVQLISVEASQPYIAGRHFGADINFNLYRQDTTYFTTDTEIGIPFTLPDQTIIRAFLKTGGSTLIAGDGEVASLNSKAAGLREQSFGVSYSRRFIDNPINPYRGHKITISARAGTKKTTPPGAGNDNESERRNEGVASTDLQWFLPLTGRSTLMVSNQSAVKFNVGPNSEANYYYANELFLLGGINSIRGFSERSIAASSYSVQQLEYRYITGPASYISLFFDGMIYKRKTPEGEILDTPFGFGAGISFDTRAGQFNLNYALGREMSNPLSLNSSRIHIGIVNRF